MLHIDASPFPDSAFLSSGCCKSFAKQNDKAQPPLKRLDARVRFGRFKAQPSSESGGWTLKLVCQSESFLRRLEGGLAEETEEEAGLSTFASEHHHGPNLPSHFALEGVHDNMQHACHEYTIMDIHGSYKHPQCSDGIRMALYQPQQGASMWCFLHSASRSNIVSNRRSKPSARRRRNW